MSKKKDRKRRKDEMKTKKKLYNRQWGLAGGILMQIKNGFESKTNFGHFLWTNYLVARKISQTIILFNFLTRGFLYILWHTRKHVNLEKS